MQTQCLCLKCAEEGYTDSVENFVQPYIEDKETSYFICKRGHKNYFKILNEKFELLYDFSMYSFFNKDYLTTVNTLFTCLECFYNYIIELILFSSGSTIEELYKFNKKIKGRSEFREGAFVALCTLLLKKEYIILDKDKSLRNNSTHNGIFPTEEKTIKLAESIFNFIIECYKDVKEYVGEEKMKEFKKKRHPYELFKHSGEYSLTIEQTMISDGFYNSSFSESLDLLKLRTIEYNYSYMKNILFNSMEDNV